MAQSRKERIESIISKGHQPYNKKFHTGFHTDYLRSIDSGMHPWLFATLKYEPKFWWRYDEGSRTQAIDLMNHGDYLRQYGTYTARKFGTHLEFFASFDQFDNTEGVFPHSHLIILTDERRTHPRLVELGKLLSNSWKYQIGERWVKRGDVELSPFDEERAANALNYIYDGHEHFVSKTFFCGRTTCPRHRCEDWKRYLERRTSV